MKRLQGSFALMLALGAALLMISCGGGGGGSTTSGGGTPPTQPPANTPASLTVTNASLPDAVQLQPYTAQVLASGGTGTLSYQLQTTNSSWASIDSTGKITGTPAQYNYGPTLFRVTVHDSAGQLTYAEFPLTVNSPLQSGTLLFDNGTVSLPYSGTGYVNGGVAPYSIGSVSSVPPGLTLSMKDGSTFVASGTPTSVGAFDFYFEVKDSANPPQTITISKHITVDSRLRLVQKTFPPLRRGKPIEVQLEVVNGKPPYVFSWPPVAGPDISVDSSGKLTGVLPVDLGYSYGLLFSVTDSQNATDSAWQYFTLYNPLTATASRDPQVFHVGDVISAPTSYGTGLAPYHGSILYGQVPPGMHFDSNFMMSGRFTTPGSYSFGVHLSDSSIPPDSIDYLARFEVLGPQIVAPSGDLPKASLNRPYAAPMQVDGGTPPFHWTFLQGELPQGLTFGPDGRVSGTPAVLGRYSFETMVEDSATPAQSARGWHSVLVGEAPTRRNDSIATASVTTGLVNATLSPFADPVNIVNPDTDYYRYSAKPGTNIWLRTIVYDYNATDTVIEILDANGRRFQTCINYEDDSAAVGIVTDATPQAYDDECLNDDSQLGRTKNSELLFKVPDTGAPIVDFYVHVLDFTGRARPDLPYELNVQGAAPVLVIEASPQQAFLGNAYYAGLNVSGSIYPPYQLSIVPGSGALPPGLTLPSTAQMYPYITGTPTATGHYTFKVQASDSGNPSASGILTMTIDVADAPHLEFTNPLPDATTGLPYDTPYTLTGGIGFQSVMYSGTWPNGLTWSDGHIHGVPTEDGTFSGTAIPYAGNISLSGLPVSYNLVVHPGPIVVQGVPAAKLGQIFDGWLTATGGHTNCCSKYTWTYLSGALPPGITLVGDWLHGIPTQAGTFSFDVQVSDANAQNVKATITLVVQP